MSRGQKVRDYLAQKAERAAVKTIADGLTIYARKTVAENDKITSTIMAASMARCAATLLLDNLLPAEVAENFRQMAADLEAKG